MFKTLNVLVKRLKEELSEKQKLKKENELLTAKLKLVGDDIVKAFLDGNTLTWTLVQVVLYDMYKNMEVLDYGTFITAIAKQLTNYDQNKKLRDEKISQFNKDYETRQELMRGGNANNN